MTGDKAEQLLHNISMNKDFQQDLYKLREQFGIPKAGFDTTQEAKNWRENYEVDLIEFHLSNKSGKAPQEFDDAEVYLINKYQLPISVEPLLQHYILTDNKTELDIPRPFFASAIKLEHGDNFYTDPERVWKKSKQHYIKLLIHETASQEDVINFIKSNWHTVKNLLRENKKLKRIRTTPNKEQEKLIVQLMDRDDLGVSRGRPKNVIVASILKKEYGITLDADSVKTIYNRLKKRSNR